ncbi:hypothetical protein [Pseudomonas sp. W5-36]|uniref:hypothetical protein n=1 Tax=Pseudomonas sp. W5-36 TaxID=3097455 RepID=UPI00397B8884
MTDLLDFEICLNDGLPSAANIVVFFSGPDQVTAEQITHALQVRLQQYVLPDHVLFLTPDVFRAQIKEDLKKDKSDISIALQRKGRSSNIKYGFGFFSYDGKLSSHEIYDGIDKDLSKLIVNSFDAILSVGLKSLATKCKVLERAPSGFLFSKPSSRAANYFIRAESLLAEATNSHFIALACLKYVAPAELSAAPKVIYLDTISFLPVALSIKLFLYTFGKTSPLSIRSFKSYEGLAGCAPSGSVALCLISASTNCGLAEKWYEDNGFDASKIITVLSFLKTSPYCSIVMPLEIPHDFSTSDGSDARPLIRIQGERFVAQHSETQLLNISVKHAHDTLQDRFSRYVGKGFFGCYGQGLTGNRRTVWIDRSKLAADAQFKEWLSDCVIEEVSLSTNTIIYDDDPASSAMAALAKSLLEAYGLTIVRFLSFEELEDLDTFVGGALILTAAAERGSRLLSVSRRLRSNQESGTRVYLVGALLGRSYDQMAELYSNLTQPSSGAKRYTVKSYFEFPVSNPLCNRHWEDEDLLLSRIISQTSRPPVFVVERAKQLKVTGDAGLTQSAFWPSSQTGKPMAITKGFAFVDGTTDVKSSSSVEVFLTINWVLQNARQSAKLGEGKKLASIELQQVLLSPEVFSRYDDGIIQTAFLRAAHPAELDYREHEGYSLAMADIIRRIVRGYGYPRGEAALEFIIALCIGKITLHSAVAGNVNDFICTHMASRLEGIHTLFTKDSESL